MGACNVRKWSGRWIREPAPCAKRLEAVYPDQWRYNEWKREFDQFVANGNLPNLSLVRISHDHMGSFGSALGGVNTPETQQADCDLALGLMIEALACQSHNSIACGGPA
jgi:hypothetical protein